MRALYLLPGVVFSRSRVRLVCHHALRTPPHPRERAPRDCPFFPRRRVARLDFASTKKTRKQPQYFWGGLWVECAGEERMPCVFQYPAPHTAGTFFLLPPCCACTFSAGQPRRLHGFLLARRVWCPGASRQKQHSTLHRTGGGTFQNGLSFPPKPAGLGLRTKQLRSHTSGPAMPWHRRRPPKARRCAFVPDRAAKGEHAAPIPERDDPAHPPSLAGAPDEQGAATPRRGVSRSPGQFAARLTGPFLAHIGHMILHEPAEPNTLGRVEEA